MCGGRLLRNTLMHTVNKSRVAGGKIKKEYINKFIFKGFYIKLDMHKLSPASPKEDLRKFTDI
jgi:hypothetical protein